VALSAEPRTSLVGWVADVHGAPVSGALITLFGQGIRGGGLIGFSDNLGHYTLDGVPTGSYTLRVIEHAHQPATAHHVTVLPNQENLYSFILAPAIGQMSASESVERERELDWLLRHKRRSVLEDTTEVVEAHEAAGPSALKPPSIDGAVELMTSPGTLGSIENPGLGGTPFSWSVIRLRGRLADAGEWSMNGLVSQSDGANWRMSGEMNLEQWEGHVVRVGTGYSTWAPRNLITGYGTVLGTGAVFAEDEWHLSDAVTTNVGARYSYVGFVSDRNQVDPHVSVAVKANDGMRYQAAVSTLTVVPGGDLLAIYPEAPSAALSLAAGDPTLRPERVLRCSVGGERTLGSTTVGVKLLSESTTAQLMNSFDRSMSPDGLHISNGHDLSTRGVAVTVARQIGKVVGASLTYTYGQAYRPEVGVADPVIFMNFHDADFQDMVARVEFVSPSDTRLAAFYRINTLRGQSAVPGAIGATNSRFDVQLRQGIPFLGTLTRADWELLVAIRNLFYEEDEAGVLDEFAVVNPPRRILGGISVRF
jgi:outer membrane receptor protein involved in Fe transport